MLPIKLLCDQRPRKDGTNAVGIQYCYRPDKRTLLNTEIYIPSHYWNRKLSGISNELPEMYGHTELLNEKLGSLLRMAEDIISFAGKRHINDKISFLKKAFHALRFHDFILSQGILPPALIREAVMNEFVQKERSKSKI